MYVDLFSFNNYLFINLLFTIYLMINYLNFIYFLTHILINLFGHHNNVYDPFEPESFVYKPCS